MTRHAREREGAGAESLAISVVVPTYGRKDAARRLLNGLAAQTVGCGAFEVLLVDDGTVSEDAGSELLDPEPFPFGCQPVLRRREIGPFEWPGPR